MSEVTRQKSLYKNRRAFSCIPMELTYISVEKYNHFESNAASATDKENDMRHISHWVRAGIVIVNNPWLELLAGSSGQ